MVNKAVDRLWVPLITHYAEANGRRVLDRARMAAHVARIRPYVRQFLLAGSTGDGWEMGDDLLTDLLDFAATDTFAGTTLVVGALGRTTGDVVRRAALVEGSALARAGGGRFAGLTVCPPVDASADQVAILAHYRTVLDATSSPLQIYELPQVTSCSLQVETVRTLAATGRVNMFKDTSGQDRIAAAGVNGIRLVRGAEGGYVQALRGGGYDGWLLSTGNIFGASLRRILEALDAGREADAMQISDILSRVVAALFDAASQTPFGNAFSNVSRGVDHLFAYGERWRDVAMPLTFSGNRLPESMLALFDERLLHLGAVGQGYVKHS